MSKPGFYFYTGDWIKDTKALSLEARGAWIDLLCALNEAGGSITWPLQAYDQYLGTVDRNGFIYSAEEILDELKALNICTVVTDPNGGVTVTSRRIIRQNNYKESNRKRQKRHRDSRKSNAPVTAPRNGSSSSYSSSSLSSYKNKNSDQTASRAPRVYPDLDPVLQTDLSVIALTATPQIQKDVVIWVRQSLGFGHPVSLISATLHAFEKSHDIKKPRAWLIKVFEQLEAKQNGLEFQKEHEERKREAGELRDRVFLQSKKGGSC